MKVNHFLRYLKLDELCFQKGRKQDLRGQQFGSLIAIDPTTHKSADRSIYWKCKASIFGKDIYENKHKDNKVEAQNKKCSEQQKGLRK